MNNPIQMLKTLMGGGSTPQQIVYSLMNNNANPMVKNLVEMARKGDSKAIESFARNMFKETGRDFDKEFSEFLNNFK
jgi:hypothetical protein